MVELPLPIAQLQSRRKALFIKSIKRSSVGLAAVPNVVDGLLGLSPALTVRVALDTEDCPAANARLRA